MKIEIELEENEVDSPIRFATAIIERCMSIKNFYPDEVDMNYHYLIQNYFLLFLIMKTRIK